MNGISINDSLSPDSSGPVLVRHEGHTSRERSACGWRDRLISHEDAALSPAAWAHAVDIDGARLHYHLRATELYYVLEGEGSVILEDEGRRRPLLHRLFHGTLRHEGRTARVSSCSSSREARPTGTAILRHGLGEGNHGTAEG